MTSSIILLFPIVLAAIHLFGDPNVLPAKPWDGSHTLQDALGCLFKLTN